MAEGAVQTARTAPVAGRQAPAARQAPAHAVIPRRMLSQPGEAAERRAHARAARALRGPFPAPSPSPHQSLDLPPGTPPVIATHAGPGRPLPSAWAAGFGSRLGANLSHVRIHDDAAAAALADAAEARAFTLGGHVFFGHGEYRPDLPSGRALLTHELAHAAEPSPGQARLLRQPKGQVIDADPGDIQVTSVPAPAAPAKETFSRLQVYSNAMDDAAKVLASDLPTDQTKFVYIGLSPRFFKVYDSQGNRLGRVDTKDSENAIFLPGIYVSGPDGLVAITVSELDPRRRSLETDPEGRHRSVIGQRPLTDEQKQAAEAEEKKAAAEKREPRPVTNVIVSIRAMVTDPSALDALIEMTPHATVVYFVPSYENHPAGSGPGGGDQASAYASPIAGRADGKPANAPPWPVALEGPKLVPVDADPTFEAKVDWSANGNFSVTSQVISQVGEDIHYRWELFDITKYARQQEAKAAAKKETGDAAAPAAKTLDERIKDFTASKRGAGKDVTGIGGANREFAREFEDWWSDTKRAAHGVVNPSGDTVAAQLSHGVASRTALELTPVSVLVTAVHAALRWIAELFAGPRKQQEIPLRDKGIFLIRVITTPAVGEDTQGNQVIRPSSVAGKVVEVTGMETAVEESLGEPSARLATLQAQIDLARKAGNQAKADYLQSLFDEANERFFGDPLTVLRKARDAKQAELKAFRHDYPSLSDYSRQHDVAKIDEQIDAYLRHEKQRTEGASGLAAATRVTASLISEVTGEQYPLLLAAGPMPKEGDRFRWMLSDVTSGDGKAYVGYGGTPSAAFRSALEQFGAQAAYGRGRIGVRTLGLGLEDGAPARMFADSAPADWALATKRIDDLVATLALLGLAVESAGTAAVLIGAAAAAARLIQRWQAGNLKLNADTVGDVLSVLSAVGVAGELAASLRVQRFEKAFTVMKAGAATEEELAQAGQLMARAESLAAAATVANEAIGYVGMFWGDLSVIDNMLAISQQEQSGQITHAAARRARAEAISAAVQNNALIFLGKAIKAGKAAKAAAGPREPAGGAHEPTPAAREPAGGEPAPGERETAAPGEREGEKERVTGGAPAPAPAAERVSTDAELRNVLPADLRDLLTFGGVEGDAVRIEWTPDQDGLVSKITIRVGPETTPRMLRLHVETVRTMQRYQGFSGRIRRALTWIADAFGHETLDPRKPSFQTRLEIEKLSRIVADQMNAMAAMEPDAREAAEGKLDVLRSQLEEHMAALDIGEVNPDASVSARGVARRNAKRYNDLLAELRQHEPGSPEHKKIRRQMYELTGGTLPMESWSRIYDANMKNAARANEIVEAERVRLGWRKGSVEFTIEMPRGADRRLDLANEATREGAEVKAYSEGTVYLSADIDAEVTRDATIVKQQKWKITWIFVDCEPSGPLEQELLRSGIIIELRVSYGNSSRLLDRLYPLLPAGSRR